MHRCVTTKWIRLPSVSHKTGPTGEPQSCAHTHSHTHMPHLWKQRTHTWPYTVSPSGVCVHGVNSNTLTIRVKTMWGIEEQMKNKNEYMSEIWKWINILEFNLKNWCLFWKEKIYHIPVLFYERICVNYIHVLLQHGFHRSCLHTVLEERTNMNIEESVYWDFIFTTMLLLPCKIHIKIKCKDWQESGDTAAIITQG